jgi:hypothetical protein
MGIILIFSGLVILSLKGKTNVHTEETVIS